MHMKILTKVEVGVCERERETERDRMREHKSNMNQFKSIFQDHEDAYKTLMQYYQKALKFFVRIREIKTLTFTGTKQQTFQIFVGPAATFPLGV